ncbi:aminotransferase class V-fold PLP-dependent enzyme, partial [Bacillus altitudinis]|uniref:aminotransferase class V-fold PLP-dependent enzyme n=1 Tax=Bacillus altitudinis TaxID=293387 RepID=UPI0011A0D983
REKVRGFIGVCCVEEIIFSRGRRSGVNRVGMSYGRGNVKEGDEMVIRDMEDDGKMMGWEEGGKASGARLKYIALEEEGRVLVEDVKERIRDETKIVGVRYV